jgi:quercetin dioxygenase-like cupin family protein
MKRTLTALAAIAAMSVFVIAQDHGARMLSVTPTEIKWAEGPPSLPKGAQFAVISGNPAAEGMFVMRIKMPANFSIPPHYHPADENVTVISGTFNMGEGPVADRTKAKRMPAGSFAMMATGMRHFAFTGDTETIVQLHGRGPWGITYVNPKDDPRGGG